MVIERPGEKTKTASKLTFETAINNRGTTQIAYIKYATSQAPTSPMLLRSSHGRSLLIFPGEILSNLQLGSHRSLRTFVIGSQQPPTL